ncbi:hypothetical protein HDV00_011413 [Rhizophlyctis rosea]|nr:hypothetical protein HDV00_011413 [Rhizophlyctis rosea]
MEGKKVDGDFNPRLHCYTEEYEDALVCAGEAADDGGVVGMEDGTSSATATATATTTASSEIDAMFHCLSVAIGKEADEIYEQAAPLYEDMFEGFESLFRATREGQERQFKVIRDFMGQQMQQEQQQQQQAHQQTGSADAGGRVNFNNVKLPHLWGKLGEDVENWISSAEIAFEFFRVPNDLKAVAVFAQQVLHDHASAWFVQKKKQLDKYYEVHGSRFTPAEIIEIEAQDDPYMINWKSFKKSFHGRFSPAHHNEQLILTLTHLEQKGNVSDYVHEFGALEAPSKRKSIPPYFQRAPGSPCSATAEFKTLSEAYAKPQRSEYSRNPTAFIIPPIITGQSFVTAVPGNSAGIFYVAAALAVPTPLVPAHTDAMDIDARSARRRPPRREPLHNMSNDPYLGNHQQQTSDCHRGSWYFKCGQVVTINVRFRDEVGSGGPTIIKILRGYLSAFGDYLAFPGEAWVLFRKFGDEFQQISSIAL